MLSFLLTATQCATARGSIELVSNNCLSLHILPLDHSLVWRLADFVVPSDIVMRHLLLTITSWQLAVPCLSTGNQQITNIDPAETKVDRCERGERCKIAHTRRGLGSCCSDALEYALATVAALISRSSQAHISCNWQRPSQIEDCMTFCMRLSQANTTRLACLPPLAYTHHDAWLC